jgi:mRNA-degrading endonuclease toxin of MazEF toxin-antitoxin module
MSPKPGEVYWALMEGPEPRPLIVVSREELNRGDYVVAVPVTSRSFGERRRLPNSVAFRAGQFGLTKDCVAQAEAIAQVAKDELDLDTGPVGALDGTTLRELLKAIGYVLRTEYEPA